AAALAGRAAALGVAIGVAGRRALAGRRVAHLRHRAAAPAGAGAVRVAVVTAAAAELADTVAVGAGVVDRAVAVDELLRRHHVAHAHEPRLVLLHLVVVGEDGVEGHRVGDVPVRDAAVVLAHRALGADAVAALLAEA